MSNSEEMLLQMKGICKRFPGVVALDHVDFFIRRGEVHVLMGENGAGKSTLIKILTGIYRMDEGEILFDGQPLNPVDALDVQRKGISTIYQEISLIPQLSVAENIFLGREFRQKGLINWKQTRQEAQKLLDDMGMDIDVTRPVESYGTAIQQMIALARATWLKEKYIDAVRIKTPGMEQTISNLSGGNQQKVLLARWLCMKPDLLILDEPTRGIDVGAKKEIEALIREIADQGISILLISSEFEELVRNCDRLVVVREGHNVGELRGKEISEENIMRVIAQERRKEAVS